MAQSSNRAVPIVAILVIVAALAWWFWPRAEVAAPETAPAAATEPAADAAAEPAADGEATGAETTEGN
jgi:hypothetical protein